jgi:DNA-binding SARP family transcriptional activator
VEEAVFAGANMQDGCFRDGFVCGLMTRVVTEMSARAANRSPHSPSSSHARKLQRIRLALLGGFELRTGGNRLELSLPSQRLVALLALQEAPLLRSYVASMLWVEGSEEHVAGCLRSALWRLRACQCPLVEATRTRLRLSPLVSVDWRVLSHEYRDFLINPGPVDPGVFTSSWMAGDLLPDWYDEWVLVERERFRQLRVHALESLSQRFATAGIYWAAIEAGLAAVAAEPLRESAYRSLIQAHLGEGNRAEAVRQFSRYRELLLNELGVEPSPSLAGMLNGDRELRSIAG